MKRRDDVSETLDWYAPAPSHWQRKPLKYLTRHIGSGKTPSGGGEAYTDTGITFLRSQNVYDDGLRLDDVVFVPPEVDEDMSGSRVQGGDLLLNITGASIGRSCLAPHTLGAANVNQHVCIVRPSEPRHAPWLAALFTSAALQGQIDLAQNGAGREGLNFEQIGNMEVVLPPLPEQQAFTRYLDRETARIDALIEKKTRFIELLREKRQALITQAVTQGLDPAVPMKDSGVEWLGQVPAHWEVRPLSMVSNKITNGYVGPTRDMLVESGVRYLQSLHIKSSSIQFDVPYFVTEEWSLAHQKSILQTDDVVIVQTGDIGQVARISDEFAGCNCHALIIVSPKPETLSGGWLSQVLCSRLQLAPISSDRGHAPSPELRQRTDNSNAPAAVDRAARNSAGAH